MKAYTTDALRNVGLFSHGGAGKTSLAEAMLFQSKAVTRLGRVEEGNTTTDFDPDEIKRHMSVQLSLAPCEWEGCKINIVDPPGYAEFVGEVKAAMRVVDAALIVLDAVGGVEVGALQAWQSCRRGRHPGAPDLRQQDGPRERQFRRGAGPGVRAAEQRRGPPPDPHRQPGHVPAGW